MMSETWKTITDFNEYEVSDLGRIRSNNVRHDRRGRILYLTEKSNGYMTVHLYKNGRRYNKHVHRLVAREFCAGYHRNLTVHHINHKRNDNRACNLEWLTQSDNLKKSQLAMSLAQRRFSNLQINVLSNSDKTITTYSDIYEFVDQFENPRRTRDTILSSLRRVDYANIVKYNSFYIWVEDSDKFFERSGLPTR